MRDLNKHKKEIRRRYEPTLGNFSTLPMGLLQYRLIPTILSSRPSLIRVSVMSENNSKAEAGGNWELGYGMQLFIPVVVVLQEDVVVVINIYNGKVPVST